MADYWKSNERKFCDFCKCWIADNKPSIQFHENGRRHKANVEKRISDISKKAAKDEKSRKKMDIELRKMEEAAMAAYAQDISRNADMTSQNINRTLREAGVDADNTAIPGTSSAAAADVLPAVRMKPIDPLLPPIDAQEMAFINAQRAAAALANNDSEEFVPKDPTLWCEAKSPEGYTYYWNVKTNESIWEAPKEGYLSLEEYNKINAVATKQQEMLAVRETKDFVATAEEYVAKNKRERLKERRVHNDGDSIKDKWSKQEDYQAVDCFVSATAGPYGKWETVTTGEEKFADLELPKVKYSTPAAYVAPIAEQAPPEPVRNFKEKVIKLDDETASSVPGFFKKRKLQPMNKKNARQRLNDD